MKALLAIVLVLLFSGHAEASRLVCFGDSVTEGYGVAASEAWCNRLGGINAGVGGDDTRRAMVRFSRDVLQRRPDTVTIALGIGDAVYNTPIATYRQNLTYMVRALKQRDVRVILITPNVTMRFWLNGPMRDYVAVMRNVARREDVRLVDVYQEFSETLTTGIRYNEMLADEVHPSALGHQVIYQLVRERL
jgi:lysophospholipase L1-like esterase